MIDDPAFVPILTPPDWPGRERCLSRPLCPVEDPRLPHVAFGINGGEAVEYLLRSDAERSALPLARIEAAAIKHLVSRKPRAPWKKEVIAAGKGKLTFLVRTGDDLTASDILSPKDMAAAHEFFKSEYLFIGLPDRFSMIAFNEPVHMVPLIEELHGNARRDGQPAVSPLTFCVSEGRVTGIAAPAGAPPPRPRPRLIRQGGKGTLVLPLACGGLSQLLEAMAYELDALTPILSTTEGFEGPVVFKVDATLDRPGRAAVEDFLERANEVARRARLKGPKGQSVTLAVEYAR
jgi:hypothetical protein